MATYLTLRQLADMTSEQRSQRLHGVNQRHLAILNRQALRLLEDLSEARYRDGE